MRCWGVGDLIHWADVVGCYRCGSSMLVGLVMSCAVFCSIDGSTLVLVRGDGVLRMSDYSFVTSGVDDDLVGPALCYEVSVWVRYVYLYRCAGWGGAASVVSALVTTE